MPAVTRLLLPSAPSAAIMAAPPNDREPASKNNDHGSVYLLHPSQFCNACKASDLNIRQECSPIFASLKNLNLNNEVAPPTPHLTNQAQASSRSRYNKKSARNGVSLPFAVTQWERSTAARTAIFSH